MTIEDILKRSRTIAIVGLSSNPERPSYTVAKYLKEQGYRIIPVNPQIKEVLGEVSYPDLLSIPETVDVVDIFRRPEDILPIVDQAIKIGAKVVWMQEGIISEVAATTARQAGLTVIMDKCMLKEHKKMSQQIILAQNLEEYLPAPLFWLIETAQGIAKELRQRLYLVGGVVRDLLLGRPNFDLDLVVEGDALKLAEELTRVTQGKLITHRQFGTAKLIYKDFSIDLTTARRETYARPGVLPKVQPGTIADDLFRRDFSINAMAICLNQECYGELIDPYNGKHDLEHRLIRILHEKSFIDDATRILRAIRYEQRLNFQLESHTAKLLHRDIPMLDTISSERIRYELEMILKEELPEQILKRAYQLGILQKLHPSLKGNGWLAKKFQEARQLSKKNSLLPLYFSLFIYSLTETETEQFLTRINPPKKLTKVLWDVFRLKKCLSELAEPTLSPSQIYYLLHSHQPVAIQASAIASDSPLIRQRLELFLNKLRYVKTLLNGEDLKKIGIPEGPQLGEVLRALHEVKLNGKVKTRRDEEKLVYNYLLKK